MAHVLFTPECRYVKQEENSSFFLKPKSEAIGGLSNLKALPLACQQGGVFRYQKGSTRARTSYGIVCMDSEDSICRFLMPGSLYSENLSSD
jgi:hypothetical protein